MIFVHRYKWRKHSPHFGTDSSKIGIPVEFGQESRANWCFEGEDWFLHCYICSIDGAAYQISATYGCLYYIVV